MKLYLNHFNNLNSLVWVYFNSIFQMDDISFLFYNLCYINSFILILNNLKCKNIIFFLTLFNYSIIILITEFTHILNKKKNNCYEVFIKMFKHIYILNFNNVEMGTIIYDMNIKKYKR